MTVRGSLAFCATLFMTAAILIYFHDKFWWPPDEGAYAYVAERILAGDVLNRDVQDIHMGYVNFLNALALKLFGTQLVSLRLPLVAAGLIQAGVIFLLFQSRSVLLAMSAALSLTALSFVQFLNPTAHWYSLFLMIAIIGCLAGIPPANRWRLFVVGLLLITLVLFRQLSGVIAGIGVVAFLLYEAPRGATGLNTVFARALTAIMFLGLAGYLLAKTDISAILLFGIGPLSILALGFFKASADNRYVARLLPPLMAGGLIAALPLVAYHIYHGSLVTWYGDTILSALTLTGMEFMDGPRYLHYALFGLGQAVTMESFGAVVNGLFWASLVLVAPLLAILVLIDLTRREGERPTTHALPFLAVFYGIVSVHFQIPIYLFYTVGLSLAGLTWMLAGDSMRRRAIVSVGVLSLSVVGLYYHAAQPLSRGLMGILKGDRTELTETGGLGRLGLSIEAEDIKIYRHIAELVKREVRTDQTILAMPANSEIYFLTNRHSPFRFFNSAHGILDKADLKAALKTMKERPPRLVFHRPADKYNTKLSDEIMTYVRQHYEHVETRGGFEIYRIN
ncbi:MAG: hypothetical protein HQ514_00200 [Rhodospirillales bacterium]|nr:hypothetical protein [Rhodospirillales bacterium]